MKNLTSLTFYRIGSFAGFNLQTTINLKAIQTGEALELKKLISRSGIIKANFPPSKPGSDLFSYSITFNSRHKSYTKNLDQKDVPAQSERLINFLSNMAKMKSVQGF